MSAADVDYVIVGGGLAGLVAAECLSKTGGSVALIDRSLVGAGGALGGFTSFSGAKFSLLPAGQGLLPIAGSIERLNFAIEYVCRLCDIPLSEESLARATSRDQPFDDAASIRAYESIVLTPAEIQRVIEAISERVRHKVLVIDATVSQLRQSGRKWVAIGMGRELARASAVLCSGGRTSGLLLSDVDAIPQEGKGLDLGIRVEFSDRTALKKLRSKGPDAKIIQGRTRTFCLNYPGLIHRYQFRGISIPGGIVAEPTHPSANVGILTRVAGKHDALEAVIGYLRTLQKGAYERADLVRGRPFQDKAFMLRSAYGPLVANHLQAFAEMLEQSGLVDWQYEHRIHFPLLDWHWETYGLAASHKTTQPGLFVAGDLAGHARGLLQAGVSGWLAAQEMLTDAAI